MDAEPLWEWAENTDRFPYDSRIREGGYEIVSRPRIGPNLWVHVMSGTVFKENEVLRILAKQKPAKGKR